MQGSSFSFLPPALAILALPQNQCPSGPINTNLTNGTLLYNDTDGSIVDGNELWYRRMRQVRFLSFLVLYIIPATILTVTFIPLLDEAQVLAEKLFTLNEMELVICMVSQMLLYTLLPIFISRSPSNLSKKAHKSKTLIENSFAILASTESALLFRPL